MSLRVHVPLRIAFMLLLPTVFHCVALAFVTIVQVILLTCVHREPFKRPD